jgi:hypothetical protein
MELPYDPVRPPVGTVIEGWRVKEPAWYGRNQDYMNSKAIVGPEGTEYNTCTLGGVVFALRAISDGTPYYNHWLIPVEPVEQQISQQVQETRPEVLTLSAVRSVLGNDTLALLAAQGGPVALDMPLSELLPRLDVQTLAILIRDMEDAPNTRGEIPEQVMLAVIKASRTAGEQRVGRPMFDALISEYE